MRTGQKLLFSGHTVEFQSDGHTCFDWHSALNSGTSEERYQVIFCVEPISLLGFQISKRGESFLTQVGS
jgi:hypothetical protein